MNNESCRIVELRRYMLHPGARETLIELFDREFIEPQERLGMHVLGQFRDLDDPNSFVWLRGFSDMRSRKEALGAFYGGPVWKQHRTVANATMIDAGNVLLLRPISGLALDVDRRPPPDGATSRPGLIRITIYPLARLASRDFPEFFALEAEPALRHAGISVLATYASEHSRNTFPALPVRQDADVFVWMAGFASEQEHDEQVAALERTPLWRDRTSHALAKQLNGRAEVLRLTPTARSLVHA